MKKYVETASENQTGYGTRVCDRVEKKILWGKLLDSMNIIHPDLQMKMWHGSFKTWPSHTNELKTRIMSQVEML